MCINVSGILSLGYYCFYKFNLSYLGPRVKRSDFLRATKRPRILSPSRSISFLKMIHTLAFSTAEAISLLLIIITIVISPIKNETFILSSRRARGKSYTIKLINSYVP